MAKQYTWTNADGLTLGGGRNSPDSDRGEVSTKVDLTETEVASVQALVSKGGNVAAGSSWRTMQDALNAGYCGLAAGAHTLAEPLLLGSRTLLTAAPGAVVTNSGAFQHNMVRTGNADYLNAQDTITGVYVLCADEQAAYVEGTLTYTHAGTTLTWQVAGQSAGTPTSIATVADAATSGIFEVPSGTAGYSLYVVVVVAAARNSTRSRSVRVEPVTGMRAMTWARVSGVLTGTEVAHGRQVGDLVQLWGTNARGHFYITATTPDTWAVADIRADNTGSGRVYGTNGIVADCSGSLWDQARGVLTSSNTGLCKQPWVFFASGGLNLRAPTFTRFQKYSVYLTGCGNVQGQGLRITGDPAINNDGLHITGPQKNGYWNGVQGSSGDNLLAFGCCDYVDYNIFWPAQGTVDVDGFTVRGLQGDGAYFELCRLYNANSGTLRNIVVEAAAGTVHSGTSAAVSIMSDVNALMVDAGATNVDGFTVSGVRVAKAAGAQMTTFSFSGTGTRRNITLNGVVPQVCGAVAGTIVVSSTFEDITVNLADSAQAFSGALVALSAAASRVKKLSIRGNGRLRADNQAPVTLGNGSAATPIVVDVQNAAAQIDTLDIDGVILEDISSSGNKARLVNNAGVIQAATLATLRTIAVDSIWRQQSGANAATQISVSNSDLAGSFAVVADAGIARLGLSNCHVAGTSIQLAATATFRIDANNCQFDNVFLRCAANNPTVTVTASGSSAVTAALQVTGGTPLVRVGGAWSMSVDGALLDTTAANHTVGASFYNSSATFNTSSGIGAYVRGASAWTRVAA